MGVGTGLEEDRVEPAGEGGEGTTGEGGDGGEGEGGPVDLGRLEKERKA